METEDETPEQEMKDALDDRMRAKPNSKKQKKDRDWNLEKSERKEQGELEWEQNRLLYESERERVCVWGKQLSCGVSQCGGRLIRKCAPPPADLATSSRCGQLI